MPTPSCPAGTDWTAVAAGSLNPADAATVLEHAARCSHCGPLLKAAVEDFADELTPEEEEMLRSLPSSTLAGQSMIADSLRVSSLPPAGHAGWTSQSWFGARPELKFALPAAAVVLFGVGLVATRHYWQKPSPGSLIAQAYSENRTIELRIPGADYAPTRARRGGDTSNLERPGSLLRAESAIADGLRERPSDVALLDAEAQADLLDGNFEHAIEIAQRALETEPESAAALLDLSTAYFLRAEQNNGDEHDYALAIEYQSRVLTKSPDNPVVLYNRAVSEQRAYLYDRSADDWKHFLQVERDPAWLAEGRRQNDALLLLMKRSGRSDAVPAEDLPQLSQALRAHTGRRGETDWPGTRDEAYMNLALEHWLPAVSSSNYQHGHEEQENDGALLALSDELSQKHGDVWLSDLLASPHTPRWAEGVRELSVTVRLNEEGDLAQGVLHARRSLDDFLKEKSDAGSAAAAFQLARALDHSQMGDQCLPAAMEGLRSIRTHRYPWVETRIFYELSTCSSLRGNPAAAERFARHGEASAQAAGYPVLELVGRLFLDGVSSRAVAESDSWNRMRAGLHDYWNSEYPAFCAGEFFADMGFAAKTEHLWNFAEVVDQEALLKNSEGRDRVVKASGHASVAQAALAAGDARLADVEFGRAAEMFAALGKDSQVAHATLEIERASFELRQGWLEKARKRLEDVRNTLPAVGDQSTETLYHETLGELYLRSGKPDLAEEQLLQAIRLIEKGKNSLSSETEFLTWQLDKAQTYRLLLEIYSTRPEAEARSLAFLEWYQAEPLRVTPHATRTLAYDPLEQEAIPAAGEVVLAKRLADAAPTSPILVWASFPSELVIWELDRSGVHRVQVNVGAPQLQATSTRFARLCADPNSDLKALHRDANQLYAWLIAPVADRLPQSGALTIEPDVPLRGIPFAALEGPGGSYLGDRFAISESIGLLYSQIARPDGRITQKSVALSIGDPSPGELVRVNRLQRLPDADREADDVAARFDQHFLLQGSRATLAGVVKLLPRVQVFHFAGHAVMRGPEPGLLLASGPGEMQPSILSGQRDLSSQDLHNLQLAVLSGCETAMADQGMVDPGSLVRIFLRSGVPRVIASKWRVDSRASAETMGNFYTRLLQGEHAPAALAASERAIRSNPSTAHPYYWAAFTSFGS
ncbi:CHAT domain-containing protein [Granulicella aggregans]|uniref:CHAT domain-containing protein n=1 Tax=Granulicella aggregans TaxID=474949 RepID=A0A7W7ZHF9_9BACT|nr:CHAT domain-containing protein [Granulicella aggregans]